jgi:hypothetical protein
MDETPTCATCRFFDAPDPLADRPAMRGFCRINAPHVQAAAGGSRIPWPIVERTDWCGEHPFFHDEPITINNSVIREPEFKP